MTIEIDEKIAEEIIKAEQKVLDIGLNYDEENGWHFIRPLLIATRIMPDFKEIENEHPYRIPGRPETYDTYNEGWSDATDKIRNLIENEDL